MLDMEVQEWDWVNYLTWEDGLQLRVEYWKLSYTPSPLGWSKVEPSPLALKRKDWIFQVVDCNISFSFGRNFEIAIQYFSEPLSLMKA